MPERWIADVMGQTTCRDHRRQFIFIKFPEFPIPGGIFFGEGVPHRLTQGAADGSHFQAMSQAVMDKYRSRQGKYLCLILQAAKGRRKNDAIIVPEKRVAEI